MKHIDTIVLTKEFLSVRKVTYQKAIPAILTGKANPVHNYQVFYSVAEWLSYAAKNIGSDRIISSPSLQFHVPEYIVYLSSVTPKCAPKLSRRNIWLRDSRKCVYCKQLVLLEDCTLDHVYPSSKGGKSTWDNLVCSCSSCNNKKGDAVLHTAGMKRLSSSLRVPTWLELVSKDQINISIT